MYDPCTAGKRHAKYPVYQDQELHKGGYMQLLMNIFMHYILPDRRSVSGREQKPEQLGCIHSQTSRFFMLNTSNLSQSLLPLYGSCRGTTYTIYLHVEPLDQERKIRLREREINGQEGNMNIDDSVHERRIIWLPMQHVGVVLCILVNIQKKYFTPRYRLTWMLLSEKITDHSNADATDEHYYKFMVRLAVSKKWLCVYFPLLWIIRQLIWL